MNKFLEINTLSLAVFGMSIFGILKYFFESTKRGSNRQVDEEYKACLEEVREQEE